MPFSPQIIGSLGLALLLSLGWGGCQRQQAKSYQTERDTARGELVQAKAALTGKDTVIEALQGSLVQWQDLAKNEAAKASEAATRAEAAAVDLERARRDLQSTEVRDDSIPDCDRLLSTDLAVACPARAVGLRQRAADGLRRPPD